MTAKIAEKIDTSLKIKLPPTIKWQLKRLSTSLHKKNIKLAFISFNMPLNRFKKIKRKNWEFLAIKENYLKNHKKQFLSSIETACSKGANIICLSEMCYPFSLNHRLNHNIKKILQELCKKHKTYIIAGSGHDILKTRYNLSYIFSPKHSSPFIQPKLFPSTNAENVKSPSKMLITGFLTDYGTFSVSICFDTYSSDIRSLYKHIQKTDDKVRLDFIFAPSYNERSDQGKECCKQLQIDTQTCVIYINDLSQGHEPIVFYDGYSYRLQEEQSESIPDKFKVYYYKINLNNLRETMLTIKPV